MKSLLYIALAAIITAVTSYFVLQEKKQPGTPAAVAAQAQPQLPKLRIALEGKYPPFEYMDQQQQLAGFNVDLARAICNEVQMQCEFVRADFDQLIPVLNNNQADAIVASLSITTERQKLVQFTQPYSRVPGAYVANKKQHLILPVLTPERLEGLKMGVVAKTTFDDYLTHEMKSDKFNLVRFSSADDMMAALKSDKIQLAFDDSAVLGEFLKSKEGSNYQYVGNRIESDQWLGKGEGIAVRLSDGQLKQKLDTALQKLIDSGKHDELQNKYFTLRIL